jgi:hypothetical protein
MLQLKISDFYLINFTKATIFILSFLTKSFHSSKINFKKRLSNVERTKFTLDDYLKQVLVGNILGDVYMRKFSEKANARIIFRQGSKNAEYLLHLYSLFQRFVLTPPSVTTITDKNTGKTRDNISFSTLALPCFNDFYKSFYFKGKKIVPTNIANYLTSVSLAY